MITQPALPRQTLALRPLFAIKKKEATCDQHRTKQGINIIQAHCTSFERLGNLSVPSVYVKFATGWD